MITVEFFWLVGTSKDFLCKEGKWYEVTGHNKEWLDGSDLDVEAVTEWVVDSVSQVDKPEGELYLHKTVEESEEFFDQYQWGEYEILRWFANTI